jgi:hypothetical protein
VSGGGLIDRLRVALLVRDGPSVLCDGTGVVAEFMV